MRDKRCLRLFNEEEHNCSKLGVRMKALWWLALVVACVGLVAQANAAAKTADSTVDQMTCGEAQAYAQKYQRYWKQTAHDGAIPIYPVLPLDALRCKTKQGAAPIFESTRDARTCVLGYYCAST